MISSNSTKNLNFNSYTYYDLNSYSCTCTHTVDTVASRAWCNHMSLTMWLAVDATYSHTAVMFLSQLGFVMYQLPCLVKTLIIILLLLCPLAAESHTSLADASMACLLVTSLSPYTVHSQGKECALNYRALQSMLT